MVQHPRDLVLHGKPDAFDIDVHHRVVVGFGLLSERSHVALDAGVVKSQIESSVFADRMLDQCLNIGRDQDVCPPKAGRPTRRADHRDCFLSSLNIAITDHDSRTIATKRQRRRTANS